MDKVFSVARPVLVGFFRIAASDEHSFSIALFSTADTKIVFTLNAKKVSVARPIFVELPRRGA